MACDWTQASRSFTGIGSTTLLGALWLIFLLLRQIGNMVYNVIFHPLHKVPSHWTISSTSLWIRWHRWHGRMSFEADKLLTEHGPIVRISPEMVLVNDHQVVEKLFIRKDMDTAPTAVRALTIGDHNWTVTYPQHSVVRLRRHPVMIATTTKCMRFWHQDFVRNITNMVSTLSHSKGAKSEDIVRHLRACTMKNSQIVMCGKGVNLEPADFPEVMGEYNFLVVWKLCLPAWVFEWLRYVPGTQARSRIMTSDRLFNLGEEMCRQAATEPEEKGPQDTADEVPNVYQLYTDEEAKYPTTTWTSSELSAEMAGQMLAATETTSSNLAYIYYELAKNQELLEEVYQECLTFDEDTELETAKLLESCIKEGLRFRPPVALTGSRLVPEGGITVLDYFLPAGTVVTTQSLSMSRQRPDLFPDFDTFNPKRWFDNNIEPKIASDMRRLVVPFGVGARRCPGSTMALYQRRLILYATIRGFIITVAPETTPEWMEPFEANGYRSRHDRCDLIFTPRKN